MFTWYISRGTFGKVDDEVGGGTIMRIPVKVLLKLREVTVHGAYLQSHLWKSAL